MHALIASKLEEIVRICRDRGVKRLEIFGSAARASDFDAAASDVDFLVEFEDWARQPWMGEYQELDEVLSILLGRSVDVVPAKGEASSRLRATIERDRKLIYAD